MHMLPLTLAAAGAAFFGFRYLPQCRGMALNRGLQRRTASLLARVRGVFAAPDRPVLASSPAEDEIPPQVRAVIGEIVEARFGKDVRIRSVKKADGLPSQTPLAQRLSDNNQAWLQEGRVLIHASHEIVHARTLTESGPRSETSLRGIRLEAADCD